MTYENDAAPHDVDIAVATLDAPDSVQPTFHIWLSHKLPWIKVADGLPQYQEWRPEKTGI